MKRFLTQPAPNPYRSDAITKSGDIVRWSLDNRIEEARLITPPLRPVDSRLNEKVALWKGDITKLKIGIFPFQYHC